jgi:hypothetical protein
MQEIQEVTGLPVKVDPFNKKYFLSCIMEARNNEIRHWFAKFFPDFCQNWNKRLTVTRKILADLTSSTKSDLL